MADVSAVVATVICVSLVEIGIVVVVVSVVVVVPVVNVVVGDVVGVVDVAVAAAVLCNSGWHHLHALCCPLTAQKLGPKSSDSQVRKRDSITSWKRVRCSPVIGQMPVRGEGISPTS